MRKMGGKVEERVPSVDLRENLGLRGKSCDKVETRKEGMGRMASDGSS